MAAAPDCSLFVTGLPKTVTDDQLKAIFSRYGMVPSVKVLPPHAQKEDLAAIVSMESPEKAKWVIDNVNGTVPEGLASPIDIKLKQKGWSWEEPPNDTMYVTGLPHGVNDDIVLSVFSRYGPVKSVKVLPAKLDKPDVAAIVSMESAEQAKALIANVSGTIPDGLSEPITIKAKIQPGFGFGGFGKGAWGKGGFGFDQWAMMQMLSMKGGKGKGKGWGWGGGGKGGGGLSSFPAEKKVWVGGLPEDTTFQELQAHFGGAGKAKFAVVMKGKSAGAGGVGFGTPEEATEAIQTLNGSVLKGATIEVDVWTKKSDGVAAP